MYNRKGAFLRREIMLIDLSTLISDNSKTCTVDTEIEAKTFDINGFKYPYEDGKVNILFKCEDGKLKIIGQIKATIVMSCDRCLSDVKKQFDIAYNNEIDMNETGLQTGADEEYPFIEDKQFCTEQFVYNEILTRLPMKVLCKEDCKGLCPKCGQNLNNGSCDCERAEIDPRMSKFQDVFNQFKEV